jgi:N utilization substance protein B
MAPDKPSLDEEPSDDDRPVEGAPTSAPKRRAAGAAVRDPGSAARATARKLALQAIYRVQLNDGPWQDLVNEFADDPDMGRADRAYFEVLVRGVCGAREALDAQLAGWTDRTPALLDPVEHAVLLIGLHELRERLEVPRRVVVSEGVRLTKRFGATDGHKFVNAVLDRAARELRPHEH